MFNFATDHAEEIIVFGPEGSWPFMISLAVKGNVTKHMENPP